jgi:hypothetical protein
VPPSGDEVNMTARESPALAQIIIDLYIKVTTTVVPLIIQSMRVEVSRRSLVNLKASLMWVSLWSILFLNH